jgi:hypothetical protein
VVGSKCIPECQDQTFPGQEKQMGSMSSKEVGAKKGGVTGLIDRMFRHRDVLPPGLKAKEDRCGPI